MAAFHQKSEEAKFFVKVAQSLIVCEGGVPLDEGLHIFHGVYARYVAVEELVQGLALSDQVAYHRGEAG